MSAFLKPRDCRLSDRKGFTLLEAMIGLMVFTIGILGMLKFQVVSINANSMAQTSSFNTNEGVSTIERMFSLNWNEDDAKPIAEKCDNEDGFRVCRTITEGPGPGVVAMADEKGRASVRLITVTSTFVDKGGTQRTTTLRLIKPRM